MGGLIFIRDHLSIAYLSLSLLSVREIFVQSGIRMSNPSNQRTKTRIASVKPSYRARLQRS
jgi:hypothetical protein